MSVASTTTEDKLCTRCKNTISSLSKAIPHDQTPWEFNLSIPDSDNWLWRTTDKEIDKRTSLFMERTGYLAKMSLACTFCTFILSVMLKISISELRYLQEDEGCADYLARTVKELETMRHQNIFHLHEDRNSASYITKTIQQLGRKHQQNPFYLQIRQGNYYSTLDLDTSVQNPNLLEYLSIRGMFGSGQSYPLTRIDLYADSSKCRPQSLLHLRVDSQTIELCSNPRHNCST